MLCGPSGVGKTETALALAEALYGGEQNMITINMSEFQEAHTVSTLKGAPPGYVGYGEGGRLTEAVRRKPYSVILLDEVEKAHPDVHEIFFQVFDKGQMEDGTGRRIDFKNTLIILTSNVGTDVIMGLSRRPGLREPIRRRWRSRCGRRCSRSSRRRCSGASSRSPITRSRREMLGGIVRLQLDRIGKRIRENHDAGLRLRRRGGRAHRLAVQRSGFGRPHDRQHHHQHAAAGALARVPQPAAREEAAERGAGQSSRDAFAYAVS